MNQQHGAARIVNIHLKAAVPVRRVFTRVSRAATAVTVEPVLGPGFGLRIDFIIELLEQTIFEFEVVIEAQPFIGLVFGNLLVQLFRVPGFELTATAAALQNDQGCCSDNA